jgi:carbamoylphosphate synthase large subunit
MRVAPVEFAPSLDARLNLNDTTAPFAKMDSSALGQDRNFHILLATTSQLPSTARLAIELHEAGIHVSLIAPRNHPAKVLEFLANRITYRAAAPRASLEAALARISPDLVIPCDERTVRDLHAVWRGTRDSAIKLIVERSTTPPEWFPIVTSRAELLEVARQHGVRVPNFTTVPSIAALRSWCANSAAPFVLKADGSWAGFGVRIVPDQNAAEAAYAQMTRRASGRLALREARVEGNYFYIRPWLRRERPTMSVQDHVDGWPANIGVACWQGEVLASICAESVATVSATGPSTVARIINNAEMVEAATRIVRALGLSGMIGFDFMIEAATGSAYLIEMNPRNTPICAVRLGAGRDLAEALVARLTSTTARKHPQRTTSDIVAFFPDTWQEDPHNQFLRNGFHDVPWEYPTLVRLLMQPERRERNGVLRLLRKLWLAGSTQRAGSP